MKNEMIVCSLAQAFAAAGTASVMMCLDKPELLEHKEDILNAFSGLIYLLLHPEKIQGNNVNFAEEKMKTMEETNTKEDMQHG